MEVIILSEKDRVRKLRKKLKLTMENFAKPLGVGKTAISKLENGERSLTDQMAKSICREYGVNEKWLRTGEGEMFAETGDALKIRIDELIPEEDDDFRLRLMRMILAMDNEDMEKLEKYAKFYLYASDKKDETPAFEQAMHNTPPSYQGVIDLARAKGQASEKRMVSQKVKDYQNEPVVKKDTQKSEASQAGSESNEKSKSS